MSTVLAQKIVPTVHYCRLLLRELSKTREKAKILSRYSLNSSQDEFEYVFSAVGA
jgi:hypothetical protein